MGWIDRNDEQALLNDVAKRVQQLQNPNPKDAAVSQRLGEIYRRHPYIQTGVALSLAESLAPDDLVDSVAGQSAVKAYEKGSQYAQEPSVKDDGIVSTFLRGAGKVAGGTGKVLGAVFGWNLGKLEPLKAVSKVAQGVGQFPWEYLNNYFSRLTDPNRGTNDTEGIFASTTLGALMQHWDKSGSGYFLGGEAEKKRVEKVRKYRWQLKNGDSYTIGRGTAQMLFQPGSREYNFLSGLVDAAGSWYTDPTNVLVDEVAKVAKTRREIGTLGTEDEILAAMKLSEGMGLSKAETAAIDQSKFFRWLDGTRRGRRVVDKLTEETNELKILEGMNGRISPDAARRLAQETDRNKVRGIIAEQAVGLAKATEEGMILLPSSDSMLPYASAWNSLGQRLPAYQALKESRWFTKMPKNYLAVNGTPEEKSAGIKNIANWLRTLDIDPYEGRGKEVIDAAFDWASDGTRSDAYQVTDLFIGNKKKPGVLALALEKNGVEDDVIDAVYEQYNSMVGRLRSYGIDEAGRISDRGFFRHLTEMVTDDDTLRTTLKELFPNEIHKNMTRAEMDDFIDTLADGQILNVGPSALSEMLNNVVMLPDVRQMRMLTNPLFKKVNVSPAVKAAQIADTVQNELWRPWALMTFGFIVRNTFDAHTRMAMHGIFNPKDPMHWFAMATNRKGIGTLSGKKWVDAADELELDPDLVTKEYARASHFESPYWVDNPDEQLSKLQRDGQVTNVAIEDGVTYAQGVVDEARLMHFNDPLARIAAQNADLPVDLQAQIIGKWLDSGTPDAVQARKTLVQTLKRGIRVGNKNNGELRSTLPIADADALSTDELVSIWFTHGRADAVQTFHMGNPELRVLVGYNDVAVDSGSVIDNATAKAMLPDPTQKKVRKGDLLVQDVTVDVDNPQFKTYRVLEQSGTNDWRVVEVVRPGDALVGDTGSFELRDMISNLLARHEESMRTFGEPLMPQRVKYENRTSVDYKTSSGKVYKAGGVAAETLTALPRKFFRGPVTSFARMAERSPAFRTIYYRHLADNARYLTRDEAQKALQQLRDATEKAIPDRFAKDAERAMEDYLGGRDNYKKFVDNANEAIRRNDGVATVENLEQFSATLARTDAEDLFFSNLERSNFTDAMRIIAPFGAAWAEVFGRYMSEMYRNPARIRKAQMVYTGAEGENGIFYRDEQSGQLMFTFPLSSQVVRLATSNPLAEAFNKVSPVDLPMTNATIAAELTAPVKQLSAGLAVIPSFGPVAQIATSKLFDRFELPNEDGLRALLNPYGTSSLDALLPGVWKKAIEGVFGGNDVTKQTTYANSYQDVFAHLASTGEYDLTDANEVERMHSDAKGGARVITLLRGLSQFLGPTAGRPRFQYTKKDRENPEMDQVFYVGELLKAFSQFQEENYETAVSRFIESFGADAYIYMAGKTRVNPAYQGLDVSKEFEEWRVDNRGLIAAHKKTAGYLAPAGDRVLSMPAWNNQMGEGLRFITDGFDRLELAQYRIGSGLYRAYREQFPAVLSDRQEQVLRDYREQLHEAFPGFPVKPTFATNELPKMIDDFRDLIADNRTAGNPVRDALEAYIGYRDQNIAFVAQKSGRTLAAVKDPYAAQARGNLYSYGQQLVKAVPDFARVWEEVLSAEVDAGQGE